MSAGQLGELLFKLLNAPLEFEYGFFVLADNLLQQLNIVWKTGWNLKL